MHAREATMIDRSTVSFNAELALARRRNILLDAPDGSGVRGNNAHV